MFGAISLAPLSKKWLWQSVINQRCHSCARSVASQDRDLMITAHSNVKTSADVLYVLTFCEH